MSLVELLSYSSFLTLDEISTILQRSPERVLFLVDGFDELKYSKHLSHVATHRSVSESPSWGHSLRPVKGTHILLVTTRSTAIDFLKNVLKEPHSFTEIIGFSEKGVRECESKLNSPHSLLHPRQLETTTSIYVDILCTLLEHHRHGSGQSVPTLIKSLGQLAEKGILA